MLTEEQEQTLLANIASVTDRLDAMDEIMRAEGKGVDMIPAFRCGHSGLFYPGDYIREWGRLYGIGLGPQPVSEALDSDYETAPPAITPNIRSENQIMHPLRHCLAQMDWVLLTAEAFQEGAAVLAIADRTMTVRAPILRQKQMDNPRSRLRLVLNNFGSRQLEG